MTLGFPGGLDLIELLGQSAATMRALFGQHRAYFLYLLWQDQGAVPAGVALLSSRFSFTLLTPSAGPRFTGQPIGRRRLGGIGGILLANCQLPFEIGDLLFGVGNLQIPFGYLLAEFLNLTLLPLDLPLQFFPG